MTTTEVRPEYTQEHTRPDRESLVNLAACPRVVAIADGSYYLLPAGLSRKV